MENFGKKKAKILKIVDFNQTCRARSLNNIQKQHKQPSVKLEFLYSYKQEQLKEQIEKSRQASLNFTNHIKIQEMIKSSQKARKARVKLENCSATRIQKLFRGFITRKKLENFNIDYHRKLLKESVSSLAILTEKLFMSSKLLENVFFT